MPMYLGQWRGLLPNWPQCGKTLHGALPERSLIEIPPRVLAMDDALPGLRPTLITHHVQVRVSRCCRPRSGQCERRRPRGEELAHLHLSLW
jgi:hypothetical protein